LIKVISTSVKIIRTVTNTESRTDLLQPCVLLGGFLKIFVFKAVKVKGKGKGKGNGKGKGKGKGKVHPCTGTEALYRPYGP
jgi:hypothetical protein